MVEVGVDKSLIAMHVGHSFTKSLTVIGSFYRKEPINPSNAKKSLT